MLINISSIQKDNAEKEASQAEDKLATTLYTLQVHYIFNKKRMRILNHFEYLHRSSMIQPKSSSLVWFFLHALHKYIFSWPPSSSFNCRQRKKILLSISLTPWKPSKTSSGKFLVVFHSVVKFSLIVIFLKKITANFLLFNSFLGASSTISIKIFLLLKKR